MNSNSFLEFHSPGVNSSLTPGPIRLKVTFLSMFNEVQNQNQARNVPDFKCWHPSSS